MEIRWKKFLRSLRFSWQGIKYAAQQQNFFLMLLIALAALAMGVWLKISYLEWLLLILLIGFILGLEMLNTVLEKTLDFLQPYLSEKVKIIKDLTSGAVFIACVTALALGLIIFLPKILLLIHP